MTVREEPEARRRAPAAVRVTAVTALAALALAAAIAVAGAVLAGDDAERGGAPDRAARLVPASARAYVSLALERERLEPAVAALRRVPGVEALALAGLGDALAGSRAPDPLGLAASAPWAGDEAAFALLGSGGTVRGTGERRDWVALYEARDERAARRGLAAEIGAGGSLTHRRVLLRRAGRTVHGVAGGFALVGSEGGVRAAIDAATGARPALARDAEYRELVDGLPAERVATAYASAHGLRERVPGPAAALAALAGATELRAAAAALELGGERGRLSLRALPTRAPLCATAGEGAGRLLDAAPADAAAFAGVARPQCVWRALAAAEAEPGRALARFARAARRARVDIARSVPPLVARGAALVVTGSGSEPGALSLVTRETDSRRALDLLGVLAPAAADALAPVARGRAPAFAARRVGGLTALAAEVAPGLELAYAARGDRVAVSTALGALPDAVGGSGLAAADRRAAGLAGSPPDAAAIVFLDLDQLLALAERTGVAEGGAQLAVRDDLQRLGPVGGAVGREGNTTTAELLFQNP